MNILIVGATSAIAKALARQMAGQASHVCQALGLVLAGRNMEELERLAADIGTRSGIRCTTIAFDAENLDAVPSLVESAAAVPGGLKGIIIAHGWLPDAEQARNDPTSARKLVTINYTSAVLLLEAAAARFERQKSGFICAISSVAGDRGRRDNYPYAATKAALSTYLQGLRSRLTPAGIPVITIKPGFVDTPMTHGRIKADGPLTATAERVAGDIFRAIDNRRNVVYTPWFWRPIMAAIRSVPEPIFKHMKI